MADQHIRAWKAFRLDKQGRLRFLFHGHAGTTLVPVGTWLEAKAHWVRDSGDRNQKAYRAGFHCFPRREDADRFEKRIRGKYFILPVLVSAARPKPRTNVGSWLARYLLVPT